MPQPLHSLAQQVAGLLSRLQLKIVFAESCTGGLVSATLSRVPGISNVHCGSAVVYRLDTKAKWLSVPASMLVDPGPVSEPVANEMAKGVLVHTPEADIAGAVTGHLGPNAPDALDGLVYIAIARRDGVSRVTEHRLPKSDGDNNPHRFPGETEREQRQWLAVELVLTEIVSALQQK